MRYLKEVAPGLLLTVLLAAGAFLATEQIPYLKQQLHLSPLLLVIIIGMAWRSLLPIPFVAHPGIRLAQRPVLRWAVAGLGFKLSLNELLKIGVPALGVVVISTIVAVAFGWWLARMLRVDERLGTLLGVGGAVCGASAIVAADTVVQSRKSETACALGIITLFGTLGIVLYPWIGRVLQMSPTIFAIWDGASLHETAQVVAAASSFSAESVSWATTAKLVRICMLAPIVFYLAWSRRRHAQEAGAARVPLVPWFLVMFVIFATLNSIHLGGDKLLPANLSKAAEHADLWLLCIGMAGVGLHSGFSDVLHAGMRPVIVGLLQWTVLAGVSYALARAIC